MHRKSFGHIHACFQSSLGATTIRLTDIGSVVEHLSSLSANLKKALKECANVKKSLDRCAAAVFGDSVAAAVENIFEKQELGEHMIMAADYAVKYNRTLYGKMLDAEEIQTLLDDMEDASEDINKAAIALKDSLSQSYI